MKKRKAISMDIENLSMEEEYEEANLDDTSGTIVAQFSFDNDSVSFTDPMPIKTKEQSVGLNNEPAAANTKEPEEPFKSNLGSDFDSNSSCFNFSSSKNLTDTRKLKAKPNGKTPPIDGETFEINRSFTLRKSTVRHLIELKAAHPDINIYLNSIVDKALNHYHDFIFNKNGSQD